MIKKLKCKFILLSMSALFLLLAIIVVGMNIINYNSVVAEADEVLSFLSQNKGRFPIFDEEAPMGEGKNQPPHMQSMSPELPYESRYFSVLLSRDGEVLYTETSRIVSVDSSTAVAYANEVLSGSRECGFADHFRFIRSAEGDTVRITFLDRSRQLDAFRAFLLTSAGIALAGFAVVFLIICFFAGRIIRPISESYEKQKRFITDAGHEIKTPLTVISANADILEMEIGKNDSLTDIKHQTKRLSELTRDLVSLARMEEATSSVPMIEFPLSEIVAESAAPFQNLAQTGEKQFVCHIPPMLSLCGNAKTIEQLVTILLDNAWKYSPKYGEISLELTQQARTVTLTVTNTTEAEIKKDDLCHVFDRFWRADPSRNSETGGHGIGLSVAKAIVTAHNGKITAHSSDAHSFTVTAIFPI